MPPKPLLLRVFPGLVEENPYAVSFRSLYLVRAGCEIADDVVIRESEAIGPRPGFGTLAYASTVIGKARALAFKQGALVTLTTEQSEGALAVAGLNYYPPAPSGGVPGYGSPLQTGTPTFYGLGIMDYDFPPHATPGGVVNARTRFFQQNKALYWVSRFGLLKAEDFSAPNVAPIGSGAGTPAEIVCINNPPPVTQYVPASGWWKVQTGIAGKTYGVVLHGTTVTAAVGATDTATAAAVAAAINANVTTKTIVYATSYLGVVTIVALQSAATWAGVAGILIGLTVAGTGGAEQSVSGATLGTGALAGSAPGVFVTAGTSWPPPSPGSGNGLNEGGTTAIPITTSDPSYGALIANPWLSGGFQVAYCFTVCRVGAAAELIESAPSDQLIVNNLFDVPANVDANGVYQGALAAARLSIKEGPNPIPPGAFVRVYRTASVANPGPPSGEFFLIAEAALGVGGVNVYDQTPDSQLTVPLYTNQLTGNGSQDAHADPPVAMDVATFRGRAYYLNTTGRQLFQLRIIGTGTGGLVDSATITVNGTVYRFRTTPTLANDVHLYTSGTVAQNIDATARALTAVLNQAWYAGINAGTVYLRDQVVANYNPLVATDLGRIVLSRPVPGAGAFNVQTSSAAGWGSDYTTSTASTARTEPGGVAWSDVDQPEAVPLLNFARLGGTAAPALQMIPLRDSAALFKADGSWIVRDDGAGPAFYVADPSLSLLAPSTAVALDNQVFGLFVGGVYAVTEGGAKSNISENKIGRSLRALVARVGPAALTAYAFGVANQAKHEYVLFLPESPTATSATICYVYNAVTDAWTRWRFPGALSGAVSPDTGRLALGMAPPPTFYLDPQDHDQPGLANSIWLERQAADDTDAQDPGFTFIPGAPLLADPPGALAVSVLANVAPGDIIEQVQATYFLRQRVLEVRQVYVAGVFQRTLITLDAVPSHPWILDGATNINVRKAIPSALKFLPFYDGQPGVVKTWGHVFLAFRRMMLDWISVGWDSEQFPAAALALERVVGGPGAPVQPDPWGSQPWGSVPWDRQARNVLLKTSIPQGPGRAASLSMTLALGCALAGWELSAIDCNINSESPEAIR
ncbi:MAG: hypothetical protein ACYC9X_00710 [Dehalococcoidia bacterium]